MCELKDFVPCNALACGQQSPLVGFLGAFSLSLSFSVKRKWRKEPKNATGVRRQV
jgi:hypothetical protein